jgi:hypothetical protein
MTPHSRRLVLLVSAALGLTVGLWAVVGPRAFYDSFPGFGRTWIADDGPFNEHLIRDVGALYLGLTAASVAVLAIRRATALPVVGVAWTVFGVLHVAYHVTHLAGLSVADAVGNVVSLTVTLLLAVVLLLPARRRAAGRTADADADRAESAGRTEAAVRA